MRWIDASTNQIAVALLVFAGIVFAAGHFALPHFGLAAELARVLR